MSIVDFHWGLAESANWGEWMYTLLGVFTSIITLAVLVRDWGDWRYQKEEAKKNPGHNRGELIVAFTEVIRCVLALLSQFIIVGLGTWAMFTPPTNPGGQITPLGVGFAIGLSLLEVFLVLKAIVMFVGDRRLSIVSGEEVDNEIYTGIERRKHVCMTTCPQCGYQGEEVNDGK